MGLFSSKKKTYVSSVAYPLGEDDGPNKHEYLKYTVLNANMQGLNTADAITQGYLRGQGMALRNSFSYARDKYANGVPQSSAKYMEAPDRTEIITALTQKHPNSTFDILTLITGTADHEWWAEQHLTEKYGYDRTVQEFARPPAGIHTDASVAYDLEPNGLIRILLINQTGSGAKVIDFRPTGYQAMADFIHCAYQAVQTFEGGTTTTTRTATAGETDSTSVHVEINERAGETQTKTVRGHTTISGSVATTKTTSTTEVRSRPQYFLYRLGSGTHPALDAWMNQGSLASPYYPAIPLRIDNVDMAADNKKDTPLYKTSKKLLDKVGLDIDELAESLNDNESIDDIDYAYVVFGVSLKVKSQEGKRYLYKYFEYLRGITSLNTTKSTHEQWVEENTFSAVQTLSMGPASTGNAASTPPAMNVVQIFSNKNRAENHDIKLQWDYIDTTLQQGKILPNAKVGDCDIVMGGQRQEFKFLKLGITMDSSKLYARRQVTENTYEQLEISGLYYENFIYQGRSVSISAYDGYHDDEEEGFILPLNQQVLRSMSLRDSTDLAYHCTHIVLNCYQVVKQKWYQSGIFKIIMIIVAIVIIVVTWGTATPAVATAMATMFAAGGAILLWHIILAATIYVLGMMVLMNILTNVAVEAFGEQWGPIIAMVAMIAIGRVDALAGAPTQTTNVVTAAQVMNVSSAVLSSVGHLQNYKAGQVMADITKLQEEWKEKFEELETKMEEMLGTNTDLLDIQGMTDATYQMHFEPMDQFLSRTLITGGDVCDITLGQISEFTALGLQLPVHG